MRCMRSRQAGWVLAYGFLGLLAMTCTSHALAQSRTGGSSVSASSFGSGSSMGGSSLGGGGSLGGGSALGGGGSLGGGGGALGGGGSSSSFLSSSAGGQTSALGSSGAGIIGTTTSISAMGSTGAQSGGGGQLRAGATSAGGVSSSNLFASSFANPFAAGLALSGVNSRTTFGNPLYANVNPTSTTSGLSSTGRGTTGFGGGGGFAGLSPGGGYGSGAYGANTARVAPKYSATVNFSPNAAGPNGLQVGLQRMLSQSAALQTSRNIQVAMDGPTVVLRGLAADENASRLAEGLVRLTPGVHDVRNEMQIATTAARP